MKFGKSLRAEGAREDLKGVYLFDYKMAKRHIKTLTQRRSEESVIEVRVFFSSEVDRVNESLRLMQGKLGCLDDPMAMPLGEVTGSKQLRYVLPRALERMAHLSDLMSCFVVCGSSSIGCISWQAHEVGSAADRVGAV